MHFTNEESGLTEVREPTQGHIANKCQSWDLSPSLFILSSVSLPEYWPVPPDGQGPASWRSPKALIPRGKNKPATQETQGTFWGEEDPFLPKLCLDIVHLI